MKWILYILAGWSTLVASLFLASSSGEVSAQLFGSSRYTQYLIQGLVMSGLVVPIILYLYQYVYRMTGVKPNIPVYSWRRLTHFITGVLLAIALASLGFIIANFQGWIVFENWHPSEQWFVALIINILFAFFYEALPEEIGLRGMLYDVLRYKFVTWLSVLLQTLLFVSVTIAVGQIQVLVGLAPGVSINIFYIILIFCFGICLQLLRLWTGSLWTSIGFHLAYLEIMRFAISPHQYGVPPIITYHESVPGIGALISICMMIIGGIIVSLVILGAKRFIWKST
ncbi:CPBP family intramembrane glutamic endopeptidase [Lysinibacillus xylanilyticus]|uniref:CPBP family intramembrane glutamic endopeptidase n=1 Tax=Lysinibacillus xylanilyticus TaxID=582475 RepID=UPI0038060BDE